MQEQQHFLSDEIIDAPFSVRLKDNMRGAAVWARIGAIFSFVTAAFGLLQNLREGNIFGGFITAAISVTISIFLFNYGSQTKKGIDNVDQSELEEGLNSLRRYFKTVVIVIIVALSLCIIAGIYLAATARAYNPYSY